MADKIINTLITLRTDTTANWTTNKSKVLRLGEAGFEKLTTNKFKLKVGDGTTTWETLPYLQTNSTEVIDISRTGDSGTVTVAQRITDLIAATGKISVNGILKGDGTGNVSAAVADTDYRTPAKSKIEFNQQPTGYSTQVPAVITLGDNIVTPATLGTDGKVPATQLPSYVDDVIEGYYVASTKKFYKEAAHTTEIPGETGKIYVDITTDAGNKTYRWASGAGFIEISAQAVYTADEDTMSLSNVLQFSVNKVPHALTFGLTGGKSFDGSADVVIKSDDIALTTAWDPSTVLTIDDALQDLLSKVNDCIPKPTYSDADAGKLVQIGSGATLDVIPYKIVDLPKKNTQNETFTADNLVLGAGDDKIKGSTIASNTLALKASSTAVTNGHVVKADANGKLTDGIAENLIFEKASTSLTASRVVVTDANGKATVNAALTAGKLVKVAAGGLLTNGISEDVVAQKASNAILPSNAIVKADGNGKLVSGINENVIAQKAASDSFTGHEGDFVVVDANGKLVTREESDIPQFAPGGGFPGDGELLTVETDTDSAHPYLVASGINRESVITEVKKNGSTIMAVDNAVDIIVPVAGNTSVANAVTVDNDDHEMYVNSVSTDILVQGTDTFVINGGTAASAGV